MYSTGVLHIHSGHPVITNANPNYSAVRMPEREHIHIHPKGFIAIRIVQLVLAVAVLDLSACGCAVFFSPGNIHMTVVVYTPTYLW